MDPSLFGLASASNVVTAPQPDPDDAECADPGAISDARLGAAFRVLSVSGRRGGELPDRVGGALAIVYRATARDLTLFLRRQFRGASADVVDDAVSRVFSNLVTRGTGDGAADVRCPRAWLTRAALNAMADEIRADSRHAAHEALDDVGPGAASMTGMTGVPTATGLPPDVEECLGRLSPLERATVQLRYDGFSGEETAQALHTSVNAVNVAHSRAKNKLRRCLGDSL